MVCVCCGSAAVTERPERTARGYRRFRCRDCGKQCNERSSALLNHIEVLVEGQAARAGRVAWNDSLSAVRCDCPAEVFGIVSGVGDDGLGGLPLQQPVCARGVARLARCEDIRTGQPKPRTAKWSLLVRPLRERPMAWA